MITLARHTVYFTRRCVRNMIRQPAYVAIMLVQPLIWLAFFGGVFRAVAEIRNFPAHSYIDYLTPGVVIMSALFSGGINGTAMIRDINNGVIDRLLTLPAKRAALILGRLGQQVVVTLVQTTVILIMAWSLGANFQNGLEGVVLLYIFAILLGGTFAIMSNAAALLLRKEEALSAVINFILFPAVFLSTAFMPGSSLAGWISAVARFNPVNWTAIAGRAVTSAHTDWSSVAQHSSYLLIFIVVCAAVSVRAFHSYQRSI